MAICAYCKIKETELHYSDVPICVECADARMRPKAPVRDSRVRTRLLQDVSEWAARIQEAKKTLEAVTLEASSFPHSDGTQHIKNASNNLAAAGKELAKAHTRLAQYFAGGIEPEDL